MITISTRTKRFVLKVDEEQSEKLFGSIIQSILGIKSDHPSTKNLDENTDYSHLERANSENTYTGFLYIRCPECGSEKGTCSRKGTHSIHCDVCGCNDEFSEPLVPMYVSCECGGRYKYMTNKKEEMFDIPCLNCGAPVPIRYNRKKKIYETIR